jgi:hypothetical protein
MRDHIHTIPVLDALREPAHCPICVMYNKLDENAVDFIMGPAYMDEDFRDKTNEAGFCEGHLVKLYAVQNRLGTALLLHTHLKHVIKNLQSKKPLNPSRLFKKGNTTAGQFSDYIGGLQKRCYICEKIEETFKRYIDTFFYLWNSEKETVELVRALPGFCLPHYGILMEAAEKALTKKQLDNFLSVVVPLQQQAMAKIEGDIDWFIQKFDYRNNDAPWKDSKDAINKVMAMLKGLQV